MRAKLILNPAAGAAHNQGAVADALAVFAAAGWHVDTAATTGTGDATRRAAEAVAEARDLVIAAGGDGTVNEALQPLVGSATALAVLPIGTANLLARDMHLPLKPVEAAQALVEGSARRVDVGLAGGERYFLLFAGIGFDAAVIHAVDADLKRRLGPLSFVAAASTVAPGYQGARATIIMDGQRRRRHILMAVLANTRLFALVPLAPEAAATDGKLDVWIFHGSGLWTKLAHLAAFLTRRHAGAPNVDQARARRVVIRTRRPLPVELDGEPWGHTPMTFQVVPSAVQIWTPTAAPGDLFGAAEQAELPIEVL